MKRDIQTIFSFNKQKTYQKEISKRSPILVFQKHIMKSMSELWQFSIHQPCIEIVHWKDVDIPSIKITSKEVHRNDVEFLSIEITSRKVHWNNVNFSLINIASNKIRRNYVDFSPIDITWKKCVEMTWKFVDIFFLTYRRNININSTSTRHVMPVG